MHQMRAEVDAFGYQYVRGKASIGDPDLIVPVSYTHLTLPTNREV